MRLLFCSLIALLTLAACSKNGSGWQLDILNPVTIEKSTVSASTAAGKRIFINYWAEWCKPCLTEIPELNHFALQHKDEVIVLGFDFDQKQGTALLNAMQKTGMTFPATLTHPASVFEIPEVSGLPTTLMLDEQGRLMTVLVGPQTMTTLEQALLIP